MKENTFTIQVATSTLLDEKLAGEFKHKNSFTLH